VIVDLHASPLCYAARRRENAQAQANTQEVIARFFTLVAFSRHSRYSLISPMSARFERKIRMAGIGLAA